jgi:hypothetical protein
MILAGKGLLLESSQTCNMSHPRYTELRNPMETSASDRYGPPARGCDHSHLSAGVSAHAAPDVSAPTRSQGS